MVFISVFERGLRGERSQTCPYMLSAKKGSIWYHFYNVFGMTRSEIETTTSRSRGERSNHSAIAAVNCWHYPVRSDLEKSSALAPGNNCLTKSFISISLPLLLVLYLYLLMYFQHFLGLCLLRLDKVLFSSLLKLTKEHVSKYEHSKNSQICIIVLSSFIETMKLKLI